MLEARGKYLQLLLTSLVLCEVAIIILIGIIINLGTSTTSLLLLLLLATNILIINY